MIHAEEINIMEEAHSRKIPTPPSSRPSSLRRPRTRYMSKILNQNGNPDPKLYQESTTEENGKEINIQKYKILPAIASGSDPNNELVKSDKSERLAEQDNRPKHSSENPVDWASGSSNNSQKPVARDNKLKTKSEGSHRKSDSVKLNRDVSDDKCNQISTNSNDAFTRPECNVDEKQLEIAIRLPDGSRREIRSSSSSTFMDLLQNLASSCVSDTIIPGNCEIVTSEVPHQVFSDFNVTLRQAKINTRTLLYVREVDPD